MMRYGRYYRLVRDLRQTALTAERGNVKPEFALRLCALLMRRTANELELLLKKIDNIEKDADDVR